MSSVVLAVILLLPLGVASFSAELPVRKLTVLFTEFIGVSLDFEDLPVGGIFF